LFAAAGSKGEAKPVSFSRVICSADSRGRGAHIDLLELWLFVGISINVLEEVPGAVQDAVHLLRREFRIVAEMSAPGVPAMLSEKMFSDAAASE